jgi:uncharacterized delta-60 repeat protein
LPAIPAVEVPVEAWVKRNGVIVTNGGGYDSAVKVVTDAHGDIIVTGFTSEPFNVNASDMLTIKYSGIDGSVLWSRRYNGPTNGNPFPTGLVADSNDNVVVTAYSELRVGSHIVSYNSYIAKYAADDGTVLWEQRFSFPAITNYRPTRVTVDGSGNVMVLGKSPYVENPNSYTVKYAALSGQVLWEKHITNATVEALAVDSGGNVVVTGFCGDWPSADVYTAKYRATDGALLWERRYDGATSGTDRAIGVAVDSSGNAIVTGDSHNGSNDDFYTAKYAAADGALLWERRYNSPANSNDVATAMAVDVSGNVIVTGYSYGTNGNWDYYTAKYATQDGALLWEVRYDGPANGYDLVQAVAVDASGNIVVTGSSFGTTNNNDYYTVKYAAADGALLWEQRYNGPANYGDSAAAVAIDTSGNVVVTGSSLSDQWNGWDWYTAKYGAADGSLLWEQRYDGPIHSISSGANAARAVAIDPHGDVVVTGENLDSSYFAAYTVKYAGSNGVVIWEQRTNSFGARAMALDSIGNVFVTGCHSLSSQNASCRTVKYAALDGAILWEQEGGGAALVVDQSGNVVVTGCALTVGPTVCHTIKYAAANGVLLWDRVEVLWEPTRGGPTVAVDQSGNVVVTGSGYMAMYAAEDGTVLWERHEPIDSEITAVAIDRNGNVVVTGKALCTPLSFYRDCYTAKHAGADGTLLWAKFYGLDNLENAEDAGRALAVDSMDNIVVTGETRFGRFNVHGWHFTAKFGAADGALIWEQTYPGFIFGSAVAVDSDGDVVVTGYSVTGFSGNCGDGGCSTIGDYYTAKYAGANGTLLWEQRYDGPANGDDRVPSTPHALAVGSDGAIVVTGSSDGNPGPAFEYEIATVKYVMTQVTYPSPVELSLALTSAGARLRFTGDARRTYRLQRASGPAGPWTTFATLTAPPDGAVEHLDPAPLASPAFYRIAAP